MKLLELNLETVSDIVNMCAIRCVWLFEIYYITGPIYINTTHQRKLTLYVSVYSYGYIFHIHVLDNLPLQKDRNEFHNFLCEIKLNQ